MYVISVLPLAITCSLFDPEYFSSLPRVERDDIPPTAFLSLQTRVVDKVNR